MKNIKPMVTSAGRQAYTFDLKDLDPSCFYSSDSTKIFLVCVNSVMIALYHVITVPTCQFSSKVLSAQLCALLLLSLYLNLVTLFEIHGVYFAGTNRKASAVHSLVFSLSVLNQIAGKIPLTKIAFWS